MSALGRLGALVPIALLLMSITACDRTVTVMNEDNSPSNCFSCHDDQNTFLVAAEQQWRNSFHASGLNIDRAGRSTCAGCHSSEGFIQRVNGEQVTGTDNPTSIHCFTCHQPHTNGDFGLRWEEVAVLQNGASWDLGAGNLCAACHQARRNVDTYVGTVGSDSLTITSTHFGPHYGNQSDMIIGSNGYEYAGFTYEVSEHRSALENACADCHKNLGTSNNVVGGHSFNMRGFLRDLDGELEEILNTDACSSCHGNVNDFNVNNVQTDVEALIAQLDGLLSSEMGVRSQAGGPDIMVPLWVDGHPNAPVRTTVDKAGAIWNLLMAEDDRSHGVHNAKYTKALLQSAIDFLQGNLPQSAPLVEEALPWGDQANAIR